MIADTTLQYTIRGKTGWATNATEGKGWRVGYVERKEGVVFLPRAPENYGRIKIRILFHDVKQSPLPF